LLLPAALLEGALFSAAVAVLVVSSAAALLFCCAHSGKANSALIASAAHQLRMSFLLSFIHQIPFGLCAAC
jgi:predicted Co/Zn/Cd cation transporter (cation efflux family)